MPAYEYDICHAQTGEPLVRVTVRVPVADRDKLFLARLTVPKTVTVTNTAPGKLDQASEVMAGYRREEERVGNNREFRSRLGEFTPEQIKKAWSTPD